MATGGFKLSLGGAKGKPGLKAPLEKPAKRRRLALDDDEPEDTNAKQEITGWDVAEGGAVDANAKKEEPKAPRIIPVQPNRDWREEAQKKHLARSGAPPTGNGEDEERREEPKIAFGLVTFDKKDGEGEGADPEPMDVDGEAKVEDTRTEEEKLQAAAFEALVNGKSTNQTVIPISEEEAMKNDIRDAPDAPTLAAYEATPIEGFGAALLRGMGWKDDETQGQDKGKGKKTAPPEEVKRRPALLGIGAKPESAVGLELSEFNGGKKGQKAPRKAAMQYAPVTLRNKHTGELVTEDQLKERLEKQKESDEKKTRNNTFVGDEDAEDDRRREKRRDRRDDDYEKDRRRDKDRRARDDKYSDRDRDSRPDKKYRDDDYDDRRRDKKYRDEDYDDRRRDKKHRDDDYDDRRRDKYREKDARRRERSRSPHDEDRRRKQRERDRRERSVDSSDRRRDKRERRDRDRSRSRDSDSRRKRRRDYEYDREKDDRRSRHKDDKY
ncbi:hypothetical protein GRF29_1536g1347891 [Pseudopithomyces chartarum]|uniref:Pre-mRNA-splicing factor n=1 Tax=Pseudopithomyces chartarum TaxID=1892770 RepID=A0AAN6LPA9_9PLEO|nr:hypothetical protein GRF29_1536g1347891 [Pseudopithomyces chartarum]